MDYNFSSLSPADFEDLARELMARELQVRFEAFAAGPDGGMDGRHAAASGSIILQAKHYFGSTTAQLKAAVKRERPAIDKLKPGRYVLVTSRPLSPPAKAQLAAIIGPSLQSQSDIFGPKDLNSLLVKFPEIEKAFIKLWLSNSVILERIVHAASEAFLAITLAEIEQKVKIYAQNPSFDDANRTLGRHHVLIISGPPGVGKSTLGEMLAYNYLGQGWEFVPIRSLEDGFARIVDTRRQVFLFDDFLGRIGLNREALASKESELGRFLNRIRTSPNARFILTTRAPVFEEARRVSEILADPQLDISRYLLDVGAYTRRIKARILYNHLLVAMLPSHYVSALIRSEQLTQIIDHKNYNPRVVRWMTDATRLGTTLAEDYPFAFIDALNNPEQLWDTAFREHILPKCQHLLLSLFFCSEYGAELVDLRISYNQLHPALSRQYGLTFNVKDFEEALKILEGGFIAIRGTQVSFINPSLRDYLDRYLADVRLLSDLAHTAQQAKWASSVWKKLMSFDVLFQQDINPVVPAFLTVAEMFPTLPMYRRGEEGSGTMVVCDLSNSERIELLLQWCSWSKMARFAEIAQTIASAPKDRFGSWRDGDRLVKLVSALRQGEYEGFSFADQLATTLEGVLNGVICDTYDLDGLDRIYRSLQSAKSILNPEIAEAANTAIIHEIENISDSVRHIDSASELVDHITYIKRLGPSAGVPETVVTASVKVVTDRILQLEQEALDEQTPEIVKKPSLETDRFDDDELRNLFKSLVN